MVCTDVHPGSIHFGKTFLKGIQICHRDIIDHVRAKYHIIGAVRIDPAAQQLPVFTGSDPLRICEDRCSLLSLFLMLRSHIRIIRVTEDMHIRDPQNFYAALHARDSDMDFFLGK